MVCFAIGLSVSILAVRYLSFASWFNPRSPYAGPELCTGRTRCMIEVILADVDRLGFRINFSFE